MKRSAAIALALLVAACAGEGGPVIPATGPGVVAEDGALQDEADIERVLDALHLAASRADGPAYFNLYTPDAVFIGGGITTAGLLDTCWAALKLGGRLVANTVTLEGEQTVVSAHADHGGTLTRIDIAHAEPVGDFTGWRAQMTVVQWSATKER